MRLKIDGIKTPSFGDITKAVAVSVGLWVILAVIGLFQGDLKIACGALVSILTGSITSAFGLNFSKGRKHVLLNIGIMVAVYSVYVILAEAFL